MAGSVLYPLSGQLRLVGCEVQKTSEADIQAVEVSLRMLDTQAKCRGSPQGELAVLCAIL